MIYYDIIPLWNKGKELDSPFLAAIGGKGNGKTYSCIHVGIKKAFEENIPFVYLRRLSEMIQKSNIQTLLNPHVQDIINLSDGKYNAVKYISKCFYAYNKDNKKIPAKPLCYTRSLATLESQTGADIGEISCIIYDECLSRMRELLNEFKNLMIAHSNFIRNRTNKYCPIILLGNTFTRNSPLLSQFGINPYNIKKGEITVSKSKSGEVRMILEYCGVTEKQSNAYDNYYKRFENNELNMITFGDWVMTDYQTMLQNYVDSKPIATVALQSNKGRILISICLDITPYIKIYRPSKDDNITILISSKPVKSMRYPTYHHIPNLQIFRIIQKSFATKRIYCDMPDTVENLRDILSDIANGECIRKYLL